MRRPSVQGVGWGLAMVCALLCADVVHASPTFYTTGAGFLADIVGPRHTLDFESLAVGTAIPSGSAEGGITFTYAIPGFDMEVRDDFGTTSGTQYLGVNSLDGTFLSGDSFTMTFASPITFLGLYVIGAPGANVAGDFTLAIPAGNVTNSGTPDVTLTDGDAYFLGIIDTAGFSSADLSSISSATFVFNVDDITTSGVGVPEPGTLLLLGSGLVGLGFAVVRRKQS